MPHSDESDITSRADTLEIQRRLARYCRTGESEAIPGIASEERLGVYRRLVSNGIHSALRSAYPITRKHLGDEEWKTLVDTFFAKYPSVAPEYWRMPKGLYDFVSSTEYGKERWPWLEELLLFEWIEIELHMAPDAPIGEVKALPDSMQEVLRCTLVPNACSRFLSLQFPVFRPDLPKRSEPGSFVILIYRHPDRCKVEFIELSPFIAQTLLTALEGQLSLEGALLQVAEQAGVVVDANLTESFVASVRSLVECRALLGVGDRVGGSDENTL